MLNKLAWKWEERGPGSMLKLEEVQALFKSAHSVSRSCWHWRLGVGRGNGRQTGEGGACGRHWDPVGWFGGGASLTWQCPLCLSPTSCWLCPSSFLGTDSQFKVVESCMSVFCTGLPIGLLATSSFPFPLIPTLLLILHSPPVAPGLKPFISSCYSKDHIQIPWPCFLLLLCVSFLAHLPLLSFTVFSHPFELQVLAHTAHSILFVHSIHSFIKYLWITF